MTLSIVNGENMKQTNRKSLLESKLRKMVREELLKEQEYYRLSKFKFDLNALIDRAITGGNDSSEVIQVLQYILSHRFNQ